MRRIPTGGTAALALVLALAAPPAMAGSSFDFLFHKSSVGDDTELFLNIAVGRSGISRHAIEPVLPRLALVEADLPVALFLARHSDRSLGAIVDLRAGGLTWTVIFRKVGVSLDLLFADIDHHPGPPYGKAWGHWKKHRKRPKKMRITDADVSGLVRVQMAHRITGAPVLDLARAVGAGRSVVAHVADRKGRPWKAAKAHAHAHKHGAKHKGRGVKHGHR